MIITKAMIRRWAYLMILDKRRLSSATAKHHKHIEGEQFKSINHSGVSPAEYRKHSKKANKIKKEQKKKKGSK